MEKDNTCSNLFDQFVLLFSAVVVTSVCVLVSGIFFTEEYNCVLLINYIVFSLSVVFFVKFVILVKNNKI